MELKLNEKEVKYLYKKTITIKPEESTRWNIEIENKDKKFSHEFMILVIPMDAKSLSPDGVRIDVW